MVDVAAQQQAGSPERSGRQAEPSERSGRRRPALSPSRASDFKQCPLLYRFRAIDRLPETPTRAQARGTVVHSVLEQLFTLPVAERDEQHARDLLTPVWTDLLEQQPELRELFDGEAGSDAPGSDAPRSEDDVAPDGEVAKWLESAAKLLDSYFRLEDPKRLDPESCELRVETELDSGLLLRGFIDRVDVAPTGEIRLVDYKTGAAPREIGEAKAMFQMKFYALVLWKARGELPRQLLLMYLADEQSLAYAPDEAELRRFERTLDAIWQAILRAGRTGDFRPNPSKLCNYCDHKPLCPAHGGTPPPYPGWPEAPSDAESSSNTGPDSGEETAKDLAD